MTATKDRTSAERTAGDRRPRRRPILLVLWAVCGVVAVVALIGLAMASQPMPGPSANYGADGSSYTSPTLMATLWMAILLLDVVALMALAIATAYSSR